MKVKVNLSIGYAGADRSDELELVDGLTPDEIEEQVREWANEYIETWWEEIN